MTIKEETRIFQAFCLVASECHCRGDLTIAKIADKIGVSRQAISKSYGNIDDIIRTLHYYVNNKTKIKLQELIKHHQKDLISAFAKEALPTLFENRDYLRVLYGNVIDPSYYEFINDLYYPILLPVIALSDRQSLDKKDADLITRFIIRQVASLVGIWLCQEEPENPINFSKKFIYLMSHSTHDLLETPFY